ncbi:MAG: DMT family transporter [Betaproteobacteria bacterium]
MASTLHGQGGAATAPWHGVSCGVLAGMLWGLVFVAPLALPDYGPLALALGRYLAFGVVAAAIALWQVDRLRRLDRADWVEALRLAAVGNLLYYLLLAAAIQRSGGPLATLIIATLPLVIPLAAAIARVDGNPGQSLRGMGLPMLAIVAGLLLVYRQEWEKLPASMASEDPRNRTALAQGALLGLGALACWTWYPIRNALWLQRRRHLTAQAWATAQGLATFGLAGVASLVVVASLWLDPARHSPDPWRLLWGPNPLSFIGAMLLLGLLASWLGTWLWNHASTRLPAGTAGMLIVFEGIFALVYVYAWREEIPDAVSLAGITLLIAGVLWGLRRATHRDPAAGGVQPD